MFRGEFGWRYDGGGSGNEGGCREVEDDCEMVVGRGGGKDIASIVDPTSPPLGNSPTNTLSDQPAFCHPMLLTTSIIPTMSST